MQWLDLIKAFASLSEVRVIFFEDVAINPIGEVRAILPFLKVPVANLNERLKCLKSNINGNFKRSTRKLDFDPFTSSMKEKINLLIKRGREILEERGLPRLPYYERA